MGSFTDVVHLINCLINFHSVLFRPYIREGFNKKIKKIREISLSLEATPPPLKLGKKYFFLFPICGLKGVLMQRFFLGVRTK